MRKRYDHSWQRRGFALLWHAPTLGELINHQSEVCCSIRELFAMKDQWPDRLPAADGDALVVAGFDGLLDVLNGEDAQQWLSEDFHNLMLSFQDFYEGQAGLIIWLPDGRKRIIMKEATEEYFWQHKDGGKDGLPIGKLLFSGAASELERVMSTAAADVDGERWIGLYHPRIS